MRNFLIGISAAAFIIFLTLLAAYVIGGSTVESIGPKDGYFLPLIEFIMFNLVVAIWEEMYFRGLVVNTLLKKKLSFTVTAIISCALFTIVHIPSYDLATITPFWMFCVFFLSLIMLLLYELTRSIWTPIGFHFFWDLLFTSLEEGENDFDLIQMKTYEQDTVLIDNI